MTIVEVNAQRLEWPPQCCSCGGKEYSLYEFTDRVKMWSLLVVTSYRDITLTIPLCQRCSNSGRRWSWAGMVAIMFGILPILLAGEAGRMTTAKAAFIAVGVVFLLIGALKKKPISILKYDEGMHTMQISIPNRSVAAMVNKLSRNR